ncbi:transposase [Metallibacterium sp.]
MAAGNLYPAIARQAKWGQADIYFWDEPGFRADAAQGTTGASGDRLPWCRCRGRAKASAPRRRSAPTAFWFATNAGGQDGALFVTLLRRMMRGGASRRTLIVDGLSAHKTCVVRDYMDALGGKLTLHVLPGYAPNLNPDEWVSHAERISSARRPPLNGERLEERVAVQLPTSTSPPAWSAHSSGIRVLPIFLTAGSACNATITSAPASRIGLCA